VVASGCPRTRTPCAALGVLAKNKMHTARTRLNVLGFLGFMLASGEEEEKVM
jgi:hypothetical protein